MSCATASIAVVQLAACAPDRTYETRHGIEIFDTVGIYEPADVELATALLISIGGRGGRVVRGLRVRLQSEPAYVSGAEVAGAYHPELSLAVVQTISECLGATAYVHEVAHHVERRLDGEIDYLHKGEPWQPGGAVRETEAAAAALCD